MIDEGRRFEAAGYHDRALSRYIAAAAAAVDASTRSEAVRRQSDVHRNLSQWSDSLAAAERAESIARENDLQDLTAEAINAQGAVHHTRGDFETAEKFYARAIEMSSDARVRGIVLQNLGTLAAQRGDLETAAVRFKEAYDCCKEGGYERGMLFALMNYARSVFEQGKKDVAERLLHEAELLAINMMDLDISHLAALNRAEAMIERGAYDEAETLISSALGYYGNSGNVYRRLDALRLLGDITMRRGTHEQARIFYEAAADLADKIEATQEIDLLRARLASLD
jgi:tetratricopeptide (TPR) repeat protein